MKYINSFYQQYKKNYYSQNGEDGLIEELINRLNLKTGWVCEFGAGDGYEFSNTLSLIQKGFQGVFIESDENLFEKLRENYKDFKQVELIHATVDHIKNSDSSLESLLSKTKIPSEFILLSIDIDSYDYYIWESLKNYNPIIVIIEINSSVDPTLTNYIHNNKLIDGSTCFGSSFQATYELGLKKGYTFLSHTGNMIFVRNDYYNKIGVRKPQHHLQNFKRDWLSKDLYLKIENI